MIEIQRWEVSDDSGNVLGSVVTSKDAKKKMAMDKALKKWNSGGNFTIGFKLVVNKI